MRNIFVLLAVSVLLPLTSCSSLKVRSWSDPEFQGRPIGKAVVMGVAPSDMVRRQYEDYFVQELTASGVDAVPGYSLLPDPNKLDEEEVRAAVEKVGASSVIVTRVTDETDKVNYVPPIRYGGYYGYYSYSYSPGYVQNYTETHLETTMYDVPTGKLAWTGQMMVTDFKSKKKNMKDVVAAQIKDWQKEGMLGEAAKK